MSPEKEIQNLKTQLATASMTLGVLQSQQAQLVERARQAEEMMALMTGTRDPQLMAAQMADACIRHLDQRGDTIAHHLTSLTQTTAVSLATALQGSDEELRQIVNTVASGLNRALATLEQVRIQDNQAAVNNHPSKR